ncbi:PREDICTED: pentatricopeptide repeat-containing protein At3g15590, mitochondrial-like [Camelina sativa]|uniref:Pentatricopeptide repeat-containing protein At3g15590, mitochondrial-like n=1 Tax=Camelina sativa TaxID=90675 RepID=A0ABM0XRI7_CAMSA|nr:PREDICTED: pentatricopeptide repeat-containing protein At3g15590, mitochondrial-like [Camelina sativa]
MYSLSRVLRRTRSYNFASTTTFSGPVSKLEVSSCDKERVFRSTGLICHKSQGLVRLYSTRDVFSRFFGIHKLSSIADDAKEDKGDEDAAVRDEDLSGLEEVIPVSGDVTEGVVVDVDSLSESELGGTDVDDASDSGLGIEVEHSNDGKTTKKRVSSELYESIVAYKSVKHVLEKWVKEGKDLSQAEVSLAIHNLRKRRSFAMALQLWEWLRANKQFEFTEANYASQLDLVSKVHGLQKAENFLKDIPESFRGEVVYRTLLANCVLKHHVNKAEDLFSKMRELKFPTSVFACNQLLLLYSMHDRKKIADVLLLMEKENIKPTGRKERAREVMKEIEGKGLKQTPWVCRSLLPLYADIGDTDNVRRLSKFVDENPRYDNCISAIKAWGKLKEIEEAEAVFERLVKKYNIFPMLPYFALMEIYTENKMLAKGKDLVKRMGNAGIKIGPSTWHALVKLYIKAGEVGKAELILKRATKDNKMRPMFISYMVILEEYAKRGDVHNAEKVFLRMKSAGYAAQLMQYETVLMAYINAKTPAYGMIQRMKADNVFPNKTLTAKLARVNPFSKSPVSILLDE